MKRRWDVQGCWNPWLSVGVHVDHTDPSVALHLPLVVLAVGRLKQPGFPAMPDGFGLRWWLDARAKRRRTPTPCPECGSDDVLLDEHDLGAGARWVATTCQGCRRTEILRDDLYPECEGKVGRAWCGWRQPDGRVVW